MVYYLLNFKICFIIMHVIMYNLFFYLEKSQEFSLTVNTYF